MLGRAPFVAFIPVRDLVVARRFYEETLGLRVTGETRYAIVLTAGGTRVRLTQVDDLHSQPFTIAGWEVPDIAAAVGAPAARGIAFVRDDGMSQDADGVCVTPGGDFVAWFMDPDGNTLSLTSSRRRQA